MEPQNAKFEMQKSKVLPIDDSNNKKKEYSTTLENEVTIWSYQEPKISMKLSL